MSSDRTQPDDPALTLRIEASRAAQERTRLAFFATTLISLALVTGAWNAYISFFRWPFAYEFSDTSDSVKLGKQSHNRSGTQELQKEVLSAWVRSRWINISLLGINVGVDDASTVGAVALIVALIWFYFMIRRENHTIGHLLLDYRYSSRKTRWLIFHGINSFTVFSNVGQSDAPIASCKDQPRETQIRSLRFISRHLYYLPFVALMFLVVFEWLSLFRTSPFRPPFDKAVIRVFWEELGVWETVLIVLWRVFSLVLAIPVFLLCRRICIFDRATEDILRDFVDTLQTETPIGGCKKGAPR